MKTIVALSVIAAIAQAENILPQAPEKSRYAETVARSPFVLETKAVEEPVVEQVNVFKDLYLRGVGKAEGKDYVLVQRLGEEKPMRFLGSEPGEDGLLVKTVRVGNNFRETKVVMQKGAEIGEIGFKEEAIASPQPAPQMRPGTPGVPPGFNRPGLPTMQGTTPGQQRTVPPVAPPIPRPQVPTAVPLPNPTTTIQSPANDPNRRQRVRVINN